MSSSIVTRVCDGHECAVCGELIRATDAGCVVAVPSKRLKGLSKATRAQLRIKWNVAKDSNSFHYCCWESIGKRPIRRTGRGDTKAAKSAGAVVDAPSERSSPEEIDLIQEVEETLERFDTVETVKAQAINAAQHLRDSAYSVCFTGAGISAAAGIPTYRGAEGIDTVSAFGGAVPDLVDIKRANIDVTSAGSSNSSSSSASKSSSKIIGTDVIDLTAVVGEKRKKNQSKPAKVAVAKKNCRLIEEEEEDPSAEYTKLVPTYTHRALAALHRCDLMHFCITQNCDDLHHRGGFPREKLSELHGNVFCEYCEDCETEYFRDYCVDLWSTDCRKEAWYERCPACRFGHYTGRRCTALLQQSSTSAPESRPSSATQSSSSTTVTASPTAAAAVGEKRGKKQCNGKLRDTIINFGDDLHAGCVLGGLPRATKESRKADLCLCLGSSLTVTPANSLPRKAKKQLIICNLQKTELDGFASIRVWASTDLFMRFLLQELQVAVDAYDCSLRGITHDHGKTLNSIA